MHILYQQDNMLLAVLELVLPVLLVQPKKHKVEKYLLLGTMVHEN